MNTGLVLIVLILIVSTECSQYQYCEDVPTIFGQIQACDGGHVSKSLRQNTECRPRPKLLRLPWPNNTDVQQMTPSYVEVNLCDGACHSNSQGCVATKTIEKQIPVMLAKCGISTGKCSKECVYVSVEEHTECGCTCERVKDDCKSDKHHFVQDMCQCECRDSQARRSCLDQERSWSEQDCSCGCPAMHTCSSGSTYSYTTCSCTVEMDTMIVTEKRVQRSNNASFFSWELVIIIILLLLILVMISIIFSLISKIQSCSRQLASSKIPPPPPPPHNYMQLPPPKPDRRHLPVVEPAFPSPYGFPSMDMNNIDSLPDPACQECFYQGVGEGGIPGNVDYRSAELGEAVRLFQHSMAK